MWWRWAAMRAHSAPTAAVAPAARRRHGAMWPRTRLSGCGASLWWPRGPPPARPPGLRGRRVAHTPPGCRPCSGVSSPHGRPTQRGRPAPRSSMPTAATSAARRAWAAGSALSVDVRSSCALLSSSSVSVVPLLSVLWPAGVPFSSSSPSLSRPLRPSHTRRSCSPVGGTLLPLAGRVTAFIQKKKRRGRRRRARTARLWRACACAAPIPLIAWRCGGCAKGPRGPAAAAMHPGPPPARRRL